MTKTRLALTLNCLLFISLILASCSGVPTLPSFFEQPTPTVEPTVVASLPYPSALIETDPPIGTVIGHQTAITFYFNQPMNKTSVESAFRGLPGGTFTWNDESTLVFTPSQPYPPNTTLNIGIINSIQSASGFGMVEPIQISFAVADYLRGTNLLPQANSTDVNVDAAIAVSFNQPVVPLGADSSSPPAAFNIQPPVKGRGEWTNTSTYIFYPDPAMAGGTEYTVSINQDLKTVTGTGLNGSVVNAWKFVTAKPRVVSLSPSADSPIPPNAEFKLTFNQPIDRQSAQLNFLLSGTEGSLNGKYAWNDDDTVLTFTPDAPLARGAGYTLNLGTGAKSKSGMNLGAEYGAVLHTYDNFTISETKTDYSSTSFTFNAPLAKGDYEDLVTVSPAVADMNVSVSDTGLYVYGSFVHDAEYKFTLSGEISDQWGQTLGTPFSLDIHTPPLNPSLNVLPYSLTLFVRPDEPVLYANAANIQNADVTVAPLPLQDFFTLQGSYETQQAYTPAEPSVYPQDIKLGPGESANVKLNLTQANNQLPPGLYYVSVSSPQIQSKMVYFAASSQVNLTFKLGATEALVWAVDLPSQTMVVNMPVTIYDDAGSVLGAGTTDTNGLWKGPINGYDGEVIAVLGSPGDEYFALATASWNMGVEAGSFGYAQQVQAPHDQIYMYTDRPIYRPGQTVYFRGVARKIFNGRYEKSSIDSVPLVLNDAQGTQLTTFNAPLSSYGTFNGQFELSQDAVPGNYTFMNSSLDFYFPFEVAEYRKPEIDLKVNFSSDAVKQGGPANVTVNAQYFFGAPAGNADVHWSLYTKPDHFYLPNYQTGTIDTEWLDPFPFPSESDSQYFGKLLGEGTAQTTPEGILSISLPATPESDSPQVFTLEATVTDESGLPVSARSTMRVHPGDFYIGLHPDQWTATANTETGFEVYTVDWSGNPSGDKMLAAEFKQVRWEKATDKNGFPKYTPVYTTESSSNLATGPDGKARLSFAPKNAGTYMLDVSGNGARSQVLIWVGGQGTAAWPDLSNQKIELTADKDSYSAGDTAKIFIPNPFATNTLALVTVERGLVTKADVIPLHGSGGEYSLSLTEDDTPNVYVSVTILGQGNEFREGLVNIPVKPDAQELNIQLTSTPPEAGPRDQVTFDMLVTDKKGQPVQGEFSMSVVDQAVLALAEPNAQDILPAFYSNQPLGIRTGLSLAVYGGRNVLMPGGLGGGGGGEVPFLREDFPDTAYWNPALITNAEGRGQVTMTLPDSLTTWQIDVRGLTEDTKVGQAETLVVSTKPLLIRPVTPRFLVSGDHVLMAAVVNNNTADKLSVTANIQSDGFVLDNPESAARKFDISPNAQARVEWWGTAGTSDSAELIFSVASSGTPALQDSARPAWGKLPILQYTSPQAFVTGGALRGAVTQQETVSLPRTFTPGPGSGLDVELSPSLAGSLLSALEAMEVPNSSISAEASLSYLLPNLEVYRALNNAGLKDPALSERVEKNLNTGVSRLQSLQNEDGGWSWWGQAKEGEKSDPYISAYVVFGLLRARQTSSPVSDDVLNRAAAYLKESQPRITADTTGEELDQLAFTHFVLSQAGTTDKTIAGALFDSRDRMSPTGWAWTAFIITSINPADARARELLNNLEGQAVRTSSSAHWETQPSNIVQRGSALYTTSVVTFVLAQLDPANQIVFDAVRYIAAHRNARGLWNIGHENAWAMMALNEAMVGFGDLHSDFTFNATLNGSPLTSGDVNGIQTAPVEAHVPLAYLSPNSPNLLAIQRDDGLGRLYYNVVLKINRPVQDVKALDEGMSIDRAYCIIERTKASTQTCASLTSLKLAPDKQITARLTLTLPHDAYYVMVEDHIPAGMEILNRNLKTSQLGVDPVGVQAQFEDKDPFANGWGWWLFNEPQIHDKGILFTADMLPAGTYVLTYTLIPVQAGEFRVLPAHAWQSFFPEVQGTSTGMIFEVKP